MAALATSALVQQREEWPDADFDIPDGQPIHVAGDKDDDDEDWDLEMDLASTKSVGPALSDSSSGLFSSADSQPAFSIRPPISLDDITDDDDDEGVSTIKVAALVKPATKTPQPAIEEDFEDGFSLPSDLTRLSLVPLSLHHRSSKSSLEWGEKDHTTSSQSSDAYSTLGFADASPSSNSTSSVSQPETETDEDDDDEGDLEGIEFPLSMMESKHMARTLTMILEKKKTIVPDFMPKLASPAEDDFEEGLVIDDDIDLSPSRLVTHGARNSHNSSRSSSIRAPTRPGSVLRTSSRLAPARARSPQSPPKSTSPPCRRTRMSPSPTILFPHRMMASQPPPSAPSTATSFLSPKASSLRGQKSHSGLKLAPLSTGPRLTRKASLSSLMEASQSPTSGSRSSTPAAGPSKARYEEPTAASRARMHKSSVGRISGADFVVPPTRPSTPSTNPAALRLTMPTQSRLRSRPTISSVWSAVATPTLRTSSPLPRPPSSHARPLRTQTTPPAPIFRKKPKKQRPFTDGTELDAIEDLPTDRDQESRFRVQPKGFGNRIPGGTYSSKVTEKGTIRKKSRLDLTTSPEPKPSAPSNSSYLRRSSRPEGSPRKKKARPTIEPGLRKKPVLIRNLSGAAAPKVEGAMKWNPQTFRWEGNEVILKEFDVVVTSTRPALITHLTGSSIGSPVGPFAARNGHMVFDPKRLCWNSTLPPEEDEPDVFANLADDEDDDAWETRGGTIKASLANSTASSTASTTPRPLPSPSQSHSGSERGSRSSILCEIDDDFAENCQRAEERHRIEMKGWRSTGSTDRTRTYLYEIRAVATRNYS